MKNLSPALQAHPQAQLLAWSLPVVAMLGLWTQGGTAIASSVLASYPGAETAAVLKRNLYHPNWYIRFNASKSLEQLGFGYRDLIDVIEGHDRYASEILRYRFDVRELEERKEDAVCTTV